MYVNKISSSNASRSEEKDPTTISEYSREQPITGTECDLHFATLLSPNGEYFSNLPSYATLRNLSKLDVYIIG